MPNGIQDTVQAAQYGKNRKRKKTCDTILGACMWGGLWVSILEVPYCAAELPFDRIFGEWGLIAALCISIAALVLEFVGLYRKEWRFTLTALFLLVTEDIVGQVIYFALTILLLAAALGANLMWAKLKQEPGFPLFDTPFSEYSKKAKNAERITKHKAAASGVRTVQTADDTGMRDLIDRAGDVPVLADPLKGYHERRAAGNAPDSAKTVLYGDMDEL